MSAKSLRRGAKAHGLTALRSPFTLGSTVLMAGLLLSGFAAVWDPTRGMLTTTQHIVLLGSVVSLLLGALVTAVLMLTRHRQLEDAVNRSSGQLHEAQRRLTENEKLLQRAETVSRVGGFMIDLVSGEQQWTPQSYRMHEVDESMSPSMELLEMSLSAPVRERLHEAMRLAREQGIGYDLEYPTLTAKNRPIWIRMAAEVECENGVPKRIVGAFQDITERCKLEQRLRDAIAVADKASKSKSEFLANMSHEIRTPLNAVIGLGYLLEHTSLSEEQRQFLGKIQFAGRALLGVINNVLDLSKIEANEMSLEDEPFELTELIRDVSQMLHPQAVDKNISLIVEPSAGLPRMVMGDSLRMRQILINLLNNSIKFTERGHVRLSAFCTEQGAGRFRLRCEIEDTGIGIEPSACARLFTPFTQADASTTRRFGGTGLGLSIARRFVELMGGEIGVSSVVGKGSTFWIEVPLRIVPESASVVPNNGLRVLILDSNGDVPQGLAAMVRALGWNPQVVETYEQMLGAMMSPLVPVRPDALILDLHQQGREAHELIAQLEKNLGLEDLPSVIVVADSAESYLEHKTLMRPNDLLLVRPVTSSALFNAINLAVSRQPNSSERLFESTNFDELHAQWLSQVRVLVVDDSDINLEVAQRILEKQGALVSTCSDGSAALTMLRISPTGFDVILMDVQMPLLDGNEATRRIREELGLRLPIVALTAGALVGERQRSLDAGMNDFVSKPFDPQVLIRKVRQLVEQSRGEPIPMVFDDRATQTRSENRPFMRSIDAGTVQQLFGEDVALFKSLLRRILKQNADLLLPIEIPADEPAREQLKARAHKLKGSAGMIGATQVMRLAGAVERSILERRSVDYLESALKKLTLALNNLRDDAVSIEDKESPGSAAEPPAGSADAGADAAQVDELRGLLETHNLEAVDRFAALSPNLRQMLDPLCFANLDEAIDNLDFQRGADVLRVALRNLGLAPPEPSVAA
jgi:signal transduction histidine kinase/DNA-binding response OmpR family regulator/HPt (histidine-containing phosphotransfer) domain-containing protein